MDLKTQILIYKKENPKAGYKTIANALGCDYSTVRYHLNNSYRKRHNNHRINRRRQKKQILVKENGGKCKVCGYNKSVAALEFHHENPEEKVEKYFTDMALERAREEIKKCVLVCSNCHREIHENLFLQTHEASETHKLN